jgi:hypothetical protein
VWLSESQRAIFAQLVEEARASRLGLTSLDAHAFAVTAVTMDDFIQHGGAQTRRDLIQLLRDMGGTPMSRARLGLKSEDGKKTRMAALLQLPAKEA